jgi:hypothetical protein|tara:strand:+ start:334 stop:591 length:258 start_codon:yes stop_codon:yes gene_type:complete
MTFLRRFVKRLVNGPRNLPTLINIEDRMTLSRKLMDKIRPMYCNEDDEVYVAYSEFRYENPGVSMKEWAERVVAQDALLKKQYGS